MVRRKGKWCFYVLALSLSLCFLGGCASTGPTGGGAAGSGIHANIQYDVVKGAEVTKVAYFFEKYQGKSRLHFEVTIKNVTDQIKRYRLNILLPEGPAAGGFYPVKGKGIEPGKDLTQKYPMYFHSMPTGFTLVVKEL
ncbi:MAG: hypothetical protein JXL84_06235 [Deltaproteobacteria bacterium]|nr:hypothetical protein [Deltaproteobacteria bacterium]